MRRRPFFSAAPATAEAMSIDVTLLCNLCDVTYVTWLPARKPATGVYAGGGTGCFIFFAARVVRAAAGAEVSFLLFTAKP